MLHLNNALQQIRQHEDLWDLYTQKEEYSPRQLDHYERFVYVNDTDHGALEPGVSKYLEDNRGKEECPGNKQSVIGFIYNAGEMCHSHKNILLSVSTRLKDLDSCGCKQQIPWILREKSVNSYKNYQGTVNPNKEYFGERSCQTVGNRLESRIYSSSYVYNDLEET